MAKLQDWNPRIQSDDNSKEGKEKRNLTRDVKKLVEDIELKGADVEKLIKQQDKSPQRVKKGEGLTEKQVKQRTILSRKKIIN